MKKEEKIKKNSYEKKCLYCGETFVAYNKLRKFCPDSNCHDCFHNQKKLEKYQRTKEIANISDWNFQLLRFLFNKKDRKIPKSKLDELGFSFDAFLSHEVTEDQAKANHGDVYKYVMYGLKNLGNKTFEIIEIK